MRHSSLVHLSFCQSNSLFSLRFLIIRLTQSNNTELFVQAFSDNIFANGSLGASLFPHLLLFFGAAFDFYKLVILPAIAFLPLRVTMPGFPITKPEPDQPMKETAPSSISLAKRFLPFSFPRIFPVDMAKREGRMSLWETHRSVSTDAFKF